MEDKNLITKLSHLREVKPRQDWVLLTRQRIVGGSPAPEYGINLQKQGLWAIVGRTGSLIWFAARSLKKPVFAIPALACFVVAGAIWHKTEESLPGDAFYPLREAVEQIPLRFWAQEEQPLREFVLAQQRLADLRAIAEQNKVKNLPSAIQEFEANASKVSGDFLHIVENQPDKALQASRQIVQLQKEKLEVEKILGTKIGEEHEEEIQDATRRLVEYELSYLEIRSLSENQKELFESAKALAGEGNYTEALEVVWELSQRAQP